MSKFVVYYDGDITDFETLEEAKEYAQDAVYQGTPAEIYEVVREWVAFVPEPQVEFSQEY